MMRSAIFITVLALFFPAMLAIVLALARAVYDLPPTRVDLESATVVEDESGGKILEVRCERTESFQLYNWNSDLARVDPAVFVPACLVDAHGQLTALLVPSSASAREGYFHALYCRSYRGGCDTVEMGGRDTLARYFRVWPHDKMASAERQ